MLNPKYNYWYFFVIITGLYLVAMSIALLTQFLYISQGSVPGNVAKFIDKATWSAMLPSLRNFVLNEAWGFFIVQSFFITLAGFCFLSKAWERFRAFCKTQLSGYFDSENDSTVSFFFYLAYQFFKHFILFPAILVWKVNRWEGVLARLSEGLFTTCTNSLAVLVLLQVFSRRKIPTMIIVIIAHLLLDLYYNVAQPGEILANYDSLEITDANSGIAALLKRVGFPLNRVGIMPGTINAYIIGWGRTAIVLIGTGLQAIGLSPRLVEAILAHELGHWVYYHQAVEVAITYILKVLKTIALLYVIDCSKFYQAFGFKEGNDKAVLPIGAGLILFEIISEEVSNLTTPIWNGLLWVKEHQADAFAAKLGYGLEMVQSLQQMSRATEFKGMELMTTMCGLFYTTHPVFANRVAALQKLLEG